MARQTTYFPRKCIPLCVLTFGVCVLFLAWHASPGATVTRFSRPSKPTVSVTNTNTLSSPPRAPPTSLPSPPPSASPTLRIPPTSPPSLPSPVTVWYNDEAVSCGRIHPHLTAPSTTVPVFFHHLSKAGGTRIRLLAQQSDEIIHRCFNHSRTTTFIYCERPLAILSEQGLRAKPPGKKPYGSRESREQESASGLVPLSGGVNLSQVRSFVQLRHPFDMAVAAWFHWGAARTKKNFTKWMLNKSDLHTSLCSLALVGQPVCTPTEELLQQAKDSLLRFDAVVVLQDWPAACCLLMEATGITNFTIAAGTKNSGTWRQNIAQLHLPANLELTALMRALSLDMRLYQFAMQLQRERLRQAGVKVPDWPVWSKYLSAQPLPVFVP